MEAGRNNDEDGKVLHTLTTNTRYGKTMENLRSKIDVRLVNNNNDYLK